MGKVKQALEDDMMYNPDLYNGYWDYEFEIQCRKEELLERKGKRIYHNKVSKNG